MRTIKKTLKSLITKDNGRSADYIAPSFVSGCASGCKTYCYVHRHNWERVEISENMEQIFGSITKKVALLKWPKVPNQCDPVYYTVDIGCNTDIGLHFKQYDWFKVFDYFKNSERAKATFATKYVNEKLLSYSPEGKVRIRFSLMPQAISDIIEPRTSPVIDKLQAVDKFKEAGYEVHLNFSPVVVNPTWKEDYRELFNQVNSHIKNKEGVHCEVIFLTHNSGLHQRNLDRGLVQEENLLWQPDIQEIKTSTYGGENIRYKWQLKSKFVEEFKALHQELIPWCKIRYIF